MQGLQLILLGSVVQLLLSLVPVHGWLDFSFIFGGPKDKKDKHNKVDEKEVRFYIRDRENQKWADMMDNGKDVPEMWKANASLKILIHGYSNKMNAEPMDIIREQRILDIGLKYGQQSKFSNIILVDWTKLATKDVGRYNEVVRDVPRVGRCLADFVTALNKADRINDWSKIHIIGLGMGAHVAGASASLIQKEIAGKKYGRITGLDPQGPGFDDGKKSINELVSLYKNDADFVDVMHCNMGTAKDIAGASMAGRYGSSVQSGHADFYPNGGETQKECKQHEETVEKACSQRKCAEFFTKSMSEKVVGCPCDDWKYYSEDNCKCTLEDGGQLAGEPANSTAVGRYYLFTDKWEKEKTK